MSLHIMGDTGYLIEIEGELNPALLARVRGLAASLLADLLAGVVEIVPAFGSVGIIYDPERVPTPRGELPWRVVGEWLERHLNGKASAAKPRKPREHVVPVVYGGEHGPDLEAVATAAKLDPDEVVKLHSGVVYEVAALGFAPGFPYLFGLPERLAMPRRATPRTQVAAGSVGIGGRQSGIYPRATPGGWQILGRTGLTLFDPLAAEPVLLAAGDRVRFKPVTSLPDVPPLKAPIPDSERETGQAESNTVSENDGIGWFEVLKPGTLTTVQAGARRGLAQFGIVGGGAMDPWAMAAANLALGNAPDAPLLECTYVGPVLRFASAATVALLGAEVAGVPTGRPLVFAAGDELNLSKFSKGARLYLAFAGGLRIESVLGGAATAVGAGFGGHEGRALVAGDRLAFGGAKVGATPSGTAWRVASPVAVPGRKDPIEVRLVPGPDWAMFLKAGGSESADALAQRVFRLSAKSDRMGLRLSGEPLVAADTTTERWSRAVVPGTVQVPPDGQPIVLMAEGQTIGGYLQLGQVASIDLPKLAQARPGAEIVFRIVDITEAQSARLRVAADLNRLRMGLGMFR